MTSPIVFPTVPPELKAISPFIQRADELKASEPIVAYWCAYFAAQRGIAAGVKAPAARAFLGELLGTLEAVKRGANPEAREVLDHEAASAAYVEGFALRVFGLADNEDRAGKATRGTAKKFLAAANFIEVLKVFDQPEIVESNADKYRYAKWKAADIARAFREGRQPTAGPAHGDDAPDFMTTMPSLDLPPPGTSASPLPRPASEAPHIAPEDIEAANAGAQRHDALVTPGQWSTHATPGADTPVVTPGPGALFGAVGDRPPVHHHEHRDTPKRIEDTTISGARLQPDQERAPLGREDSTASIIHGDTSATDYPHGNANAQALGIVPEEHPDFVDATPQEEEARTMGSPQGAHFAPDVRGLSMISNTTVVAAPTPSKPLPAFDNATSPSPTSPGPSAPPADMASPVRSAPSLMESEDPVATRTQIVHPSRNPLPPGFVPTGFTPSPSRPSVVLPPPPVIYSHTPAAAPPYQQHPPPPPQPPPQPAPPPPPPPDLTPQLIAKIQRHCRFAVSSLDYEDAEQARKELRAALALLGG